MTGIDDEIEELLLRAAEQRVLRAIGPTLRTLSSIPSPGISTSAGWGFARSKAAIEAAKHKAVLGHVLVYAAVLSRRGSLDGFADADTPVNPDVLVALHQLDVTQEMVDDAIRDWKDHETVQARLDAAEGVAA